MWEPSLRQPPRSSTGQKALDNQLLTFIYWLGTYQLSCWTDTLFEGLRTIYKLSCFSNILLEFLHHGVKIKTLLLTHLHPISRYLALVFYPDNSTEWGRKDHSQINDGIFDDFEVLSVREIDLEVCQCGQILSHWPNICADYTIRLRT